MRPAVRLEPFSEWVGNWSFHMTPLIMPLSPPPIELNTHHNLSQSMAKMTVRVPGGMHYAISEIAETLDLSISETAGLLMAVGLQAVDLELFSQKAQELMLADTMESLGSIMRIMAEYSPEDRQLAEKYLKGVFNRLRSVFGKNMLLGADQEE